ncbi:hypothetical protein G7939_12470 [Ralstonia solanacearum]|uniref:hypothetical protein n=1 Tax=Ralstonia pseudosolanacearum TaxID=1310165 RepID=UPI00037B4748|nr:hypothetical protein [Ralstonia pseudosolanacearum]QIK24157.1 hypothetical protein G7939_12470 [Ralstonia solanacearum]ASL74316.1 hypothetical protein BC350_12340 [Ralstonia pseudosolanacearum]MCK4117639.1 hypothetical protein [Ralstonia pseudosolanacearum]MCK4121652.1 hypothetical protein [Ralstonia pseudosolanacearum]MDO3511425.1 hypothetical protein [Ralstonia pseudosolanacearum]
MKLSTPLLLLLVGWLATAVAHNAWRLFSVIGFSGVSMLIQGGHVVARACLLLAVVVVVVRLVRRFFRRA